MITKDAKNIFIADDSLFFRTKLSDIFIEAGHNVRCARNGREVVNEVRMNPGWIDLLILDLQMPDIDGFSVLKWINDNGHKGKFLVLAVTGVYEPGDVMDRLRGLGAVGLVTKGFTPEQILYRVNRILYPDKQSTGTPRQRVPVSIPTDFTIGDVTRTGYFLNISETGAFLHTKTELLVGTRVTLKFSLRTGGRVFELKGTVMWSTGQAASKNLFGGAGIMFTSIMPEEQGVLREFVAAEVKRLELDK